MKVAARRERKDRCGGECEGLACTSGSPARPSLTPAVEELARQAGQVAARSRARQPGSTLYGRSSACLSVGGSVCLSPLPRFLRFRVSFSEVMKCVCVIIGSFLYFFSFLLLIYFRYCKKIILACRSCVESQASRSSFVAKLVQLSRKISLLMQIIK